MKKDLPNGVMLNAYPDSIGSRLADTIELLKRPEFKDAFSLFYILPTFFHSDLDRGFSIIDYDLNEELVSADDLQELEKLGIQIKFDLVLNHLSVKSLQFVDLLKNGASSPYVDFFVDWDEFWQGYGQVGEDGYIVPDKQYLDKLFMRKPGLPILQIRFPDGNLKTYWNTFYQKVQFAELQVQDFENIEELGLDQIPAIKDKINGIIKDKGLPDDNDLARLSQDNEALSQALIKAVWGKREFLGQMDLNARAEKVWTFYDETLKKLSEYGAKIIRLDAFAYLHKEPGQANFFNRPGTWEYLNRLREIADKYELIVFPEIHAQYGTAIHEEVAHEGYPIYDFFFPGLVIDALDRGDNNALIHWIGDIQDKGLQTINMLGSHDGIPVLDLRGAQVDGGYHPGLLTDDQIEASMQNITDRGGLTKNLYDADGKKIDYYQINATFFSALGEDEQKLRLARAIQLFMPGVAQVWYLDLFAGTNDYAAANRGGTAGHKEINRTTLKQIDIEQGLKRSVVQDQLKLIRLRNTSPAFNGSMQILDSEPHCLYIRWQHDKDILTLKADLLSHEFSITQGADDNEQDLMSFA